MQTCSWHDHKLTRQFPAWLQIYVPPHPLVKHWLYVMRQKDTPSAIFRSAAAGAAMLQSACIPTCAAFDMRDTGTSPIPPFCRARPHIDLRGGARLAAHSGPAGADACWLSGRNCRGPHAANQGMQSMGSATAALEHTVRCSKRGSALSNATLPGVPTHMLGPHCPSFVAVAGGAHPAGRPPAT